MTTEASAADSRRGDADDAQSVPPHDPLSTLPARVGALRVPGAHVCVRALSRETERLAVVRGAVMPLELERDAGAMISVQFDAPPGIGYAASADLSAEGLRRALERATDWARASQRSGLFDGVRLPAPGRFGLRFAHPGERPMPGRSALLALLREEAAAMAARPAAGGHGSEARVASWTAALAITHQTSLLWWDGQRVSEQTHCFVEPHLEATAADGRGAQTRSLAGQYNGFCQQGGFEVLLRSGLIGGGRRVADEALQLLAAPNCPSGTMDLLLAPDQMMLQIHESIGHPLELDRILGDERNFAGTSFVTPEMFGHYQYGSEWLNVSVDPGIGEELASYASDDEGLPARPVRLIERGRLLRPLGGGLSGARAARDGQALETVATSRASGWHRPPIDRMANLNVEPGDASFDDLVARVERGILMRTNVSWSIDDSRNKFQFGCEWGRLIEDGRLAGVVRNPNYRGVSATFWRSLAGVGDAASFEVMGTPFCGKGEPGQVIRVGHAAPPCLFRGVEVFGAER